MAQQIIESNRKCAEVYTGHDQCKKKLTEILQEHHLPCGLLPSVDLEEVGYNKSTGLLWLIRKNEITHYFKKIGRTAWSGKEVTTYVEDKKMVRLTGVKAKELLLWIGITEMVIEDPQGKKITFSTTTGIKKTFPVSAFDLENMKLLELNGPDLEQRSKQHSPAHTECETHSIRCETYSVGTDAQSPILVHNRHI